MHITISPQHGLPGQPETKLSVDGDTLTIDGVPYDLSALTEGDEGEWADSPIRGKIRRIEGTIHVNVLVTLGPDAEGSQPTDPEHWVIPDADGDVAIPALRKPQAQEVDEWD